MNAGNIMLRKIRLVFYLLCFYNIVYVDGILNSNNGIDLTRAIRSVNNIFHSYKSRCEYKGTYFNWGDTVPTEEPCLRCRCIRGAMVCYLRVCPQLPDPPPSKCILLHKKGHCCAQLLCQDGDESVSMEHISYSRIDTESESSITTKYGKGCIHGGTLYASGSAMATSTSCEHCFCIDGEERCIRPSCMKPPHGCKPKTTPGVCCPLQYDCEHHVTSTRAPIQNGCTIDGTWFPEGERVYGVSTSFCDNCFCLKGIIRCMPMSCAPPLFGCKPLIKPGECCAHSYDCSAQHRVKEESLFSVTDNFLTSYRAQDRSLHGSLTEVTRPATRKSNKHITTTRALNGTPQTNEKGNRTIVEEFKRNNSKYLIKLKSTNENNGSSTKSDEEQDANKNDVDLERSETVRVSVNGTINCTSEQYSTETKIDPEFLYHVLNQTHGRNPSIDRFDDVDYEFDNKDIITENTNKGSSYHIPDNDNYFIVNVSTSLNTNESKKIVFPTVNKVPPETLNKSIQKKNDEYDYDYMDATLPPSLPNLKIIPFVAADAVLGKEDSSETKPQLHFVLEREDKEPTNFAPIETDTTDAPHREELYSSEPTYETAPLFKESIQKMETSLPLNEFIEDKFKRSDFTGDETEEKLSEEEKINLFSPPVKTEGGFVPKEPSVVGDVFEEDLTKTYDPPSQMPTFKRDKNSLCFDENRKSYKHGTEIKIPAKCKSCLCFYGEIHCHEPACPYVEAGCVRVPSSSDPCCGIIICDDEVTTVTTTTNRTPLVKIKEKLKPTQTTVKEKITTVSSPKTTPTKPTTVNKHSPSTIRSTTSMKPQTSLSTSSTTTKGTTQELTSTTSTLPPFKNIPANIYFDNFAKQEEPDFSSKTEDFNLPISVATKSTTPEPESPDYEEEEEDDGFSFGSVLKYLLSDYDSSSSTTLKPKDSIQTETPISSTISLSTYPFAYSTPKFKDTPTEIVSTTVKEVTITAPPTERTTKKHSLTTASKIVSTTPSTVPFSQRTVQTTMRTIPTTTRTSTTRYLPSTKTAIVTPMAKPSYLNNLNTKQLSKLNNNALNTSPERLLYNSLLTQHLNIVTSNSLSEPEVKQTTKSTTTTPKTTTSKTTTPKLTTPKPTISKPTTKSTPTTRKIILATPAKFTTTHKPKVTIKYTSIDKLRHPSTTSTKKPSRPINNNNNLLKPAVDISVPKVEDNLIPTHRPIIYHSTKTPKRPDNNSLFGNSLLKLAGCNIYGRMYKIGNTIVELSHNCLECSCTDLGVQCKELCG